MKAKLKRAPARKKSAAPRELTDRGARTRERVMEAAIELVAEDGFPGASTNRIAERAGVTWGVLQYHFGDKQSIFAAVLERSYAGLMEQLRAVSVEGGSLHERVVRIVDVTWELLKTPSNRVTLELLLNARATNRDGKKAELPFALLAQMDVDNETFWQAAFGDLDVDPARSSAVRRMFFATLHGLLIFHLIDRSIDFESERRVLAESIEIILSRRAS